MSSKYSTLPDIDTQPDVYETADEPTERSGRAQGVDGKDYESDQEREDIDKSGISVKDAAARFKDCVVDNSSSDFSDRLNKRKKAMYRTFVRRPNLDSSEYEILPKEMILQETPVQKLRRLMYEVKELSQEAELSEKQGADLVGGEISHKDLLSHVKSLEHDLAEVGQTLGEGAASGILSSEGLIKQTDAGKRLLQQLQALKVSSTTVNTVDKEGIADQKTAPSDDKTVTYELYYSPENARLHTVTKTAELADRLAALEKAVGTTPMQSGASLVGTLEKLEQHVGILVQPRQLEQLSRRLKAVVAEMERVQELQAKESSASGISTETETKINTLFELVDKIDPLVSLAPILVTRLKGLKGLHTEAAIFSESIKMMSNEQSKISEELKSLDIVSAKLQGSLTENDAAIKKNIELVDARVTQLIERVQRLGA
ncbi:Dynamitin-domain-containing protein [Lobosporangium transversale]|uniref:Dynamitin-domain-containing protein n=1 Tax=Lobosporangium transversale TaxID=64571 RepID=A0A1Y2GLI0_9FUNG|nr:Dynamitin-domain-containing protein [Lobosporangium transversale]ORZ14358.1 Dynamitin-domain-containing protein [Lobosporangium transversale]|eukprot:XP_021880836.1 Dynamitin-domain-containing protein [Lobosporangium transversale]